VCGQNPHLVSSLSIRSKHVPEKTILPFGLIWLTCVHFQIPSHFSNLNFEFQNLITLFITNISFQLSNSFYFIIFKFSSYFLFSLTSYLHLFIFNIFLLIFIFLFYFAGYSKKNRYMDKKNILQIAKVRKNMKNTSNYNIFLPPH
jgi:hypothetical protein